MVDSVVSGMPGLGLVAEASAPSQPLTVCLRRRWLGRAGSRRVSGEAFMKKFAVIFVVFAAVLVFSQDKSQVTVKSVDKSNGVVLITISENGNTLELQCNEGTSFCTVVKPGGYQMVRLPKNRGLYDCQNVDLFNADVDPDSGERLGQYCLLKD
jgi:hypothetical protein